MLRSLASAATVTVVSALALGLVCGPAPAFAAGGEAASSNAVEVAPEANEAVTFSPASGSVAASTVVALTGPQLGRVSEVRFGDRAAELLGFDAGGRLYVEAPAAASVNYQPTKVAVTVWSGGEPEFAGWYSYVVSSGVDRQLNYAFTHWKNYSSKRYFDFGPYGGDCMNFVSQTLRARGLANDADWHNEFGSGAKDTIDNWKNWTTAAWISVSNFDRYIEKRKDEIGLIRYDLLDFDRSTLRLGDVILFEWKKGEPAPAPEGVDAELWELLGFDGDHAMIVSDLIRDDDGGIQVKLAGHTTDQNFLDLDYVLENAAIADGHVWHFGDA